MQLMNKVLDDAGQVCILVGMENIKDIQKETYNHFLKLIKAAGLAELHALEKRLTRHYNAQTLSEKGLGKLDTLIMEQIARFQ